MKASASTDSISAYFVAMFSLTALNLCVCDHICMSRHHMLHVMCMPSYP